jgi:hypothetical protein
LGTLGELDVPDPLPEDDPVPEELPVSEEDELEEFPVAEEFPLPPPHPRSHRKEERQRARVLSFGNSIRCFL